MTKKDRELITFLHDKFSSSRSLPIAEAVLALCKMYEILNYENEALKDKLTEFIEKHEPKQSKSVCRRLAAQKGGK